MSCGQWARPATSSSGSRGPSATHTVPRAARPPPRTPRTWRTSGRSSEGARARSGRPDVRCTSGSEPRSRTRRIHASGRVGTVDAPHLLSPCLSPSRSRTTASAKGLEPARLSPCGQWLRPGARTSFPCAAVRVSSLTHTLGAATAARRGRRSVLPPLNVLPRWAPPPRDAGSRTHSMPGARTGAQGHVGGVGAGCARVEATPQPPRPECAHHLDTLHHNTTGQQAMAGRTRAQTGRRRKAGGERGAR